MHNNITELSFEHENHYVEVTGIFVNMYLAYYIVKSHDMGTKYLTAE
jgi:hypothetical protein